MLKEQILLCLSLGFLVLRTTDFPVGEREGAAVGKSKLALPEEVPDCTGAMGVNETSALTGQALIASILSCKCGRESF